MRFVESEYANRISFGVFTRKNHFVFYDPAPGEVWFACADKFPGSGWTYFIDQLSERKGTFFRRDDRSDVKDLLNFWSFIRSLFVESLWDRLQSRESWFRVFLNVWGRKINFVLNVVDPRLAGKTRCLDEIADLKVGKNEWLRSAGFYRSWDLGKSSSALLNLKDKRRNCERGRFEQFSFSPHSREMMIFCEKLPGKICIILFLAVVTGLVDEEK